MEDYDVRSAASILASVKEQEARFEQLTRALEEERRNVTLQLERANLPPNPTTSQPLAWQQVVMQVNHGSMFAYFALPFVCLLVHLSKATFSCFLLPASCFRPSKFIPLSCLLIALHHWWDAIISVQCLCHWGHLSHCPQRCAIICPHGDSSLEVNR